MESPNVPENLTDSPAAESADANVAEAAVAVESADVAVPPAEAFKTPELADVTPPAAYNTIELLDDVELDVHIVLGRAEMYVEDVLKLGVGSVVELDKLAGDPVDIYVN